MSGVGGRIVVVGSSIAGLITSIALKKKCNFPIRILEKGSRKSLRKGTFIGLWTPALACLQSLDLYSSLADGFEPVVKSCYKSKYGRVLLEPINGLRDPRVHQLHDIQDTSSCTTKHLNKTMKSTILKEINLDDPSLMFINEDYLLDTLTDIAVNKYGVEIYYNTQVTNIVPNNQSSSSSSSSSYSPSSSSCKIITSSSSSSINSDTYSNSNHDSPLAEDMDAYLVVAADGCFSTLRHIIQQRSNNLEVTIHDKINNDDKMNDNERAKKTHRRWVPIWKVGFFIFHI